MVVSACLTLAAVHLSVWCNKRTARANLLFSLMAVSVAVFAVLELLMMRAETPEQFGTALRWLHLPALIIILAMIGFVRSYLRAGRRWLGWTAGGLRTLSLLPDFLTGQNLNYLEITGLKHIPFLGETISVGQGTPNPWMLIAQLSLLLFVVFVVDAAVAVWRRGDLRLALEVGGSLALCMLLGTIQVVLVFWHIADWPITASLFFMIVVAAMGYELSRDVIQAAQLSNDLRNSEERLRLAADSTGAILWTMDMGSGRIWITAKAREFFGFAPDRQLMVGDFLDLVHPEDRDGLRQTWEKTTRSGQDSSTEYRIVRPDGSIRWIFARRRLYPAITDQAARMMGIAVDITDRKQAEEALRESEAAIRRSENDRLSLTFRLITAQEEELRRLSRELHDDLTQRLAVIAIEAGKLETDLVVKSGRSCTEVVQTISGIKNQLIQVSADVHNISRQLHPTILDDLGLVRAIESECSALMRREEIEISFKKEAVPVMIANDTALCLYRIVQEGLKNVLTHSGAERCEIFLQGSRDALCLTVSDNGKGFDPLAVRQKTGLGLSSMRERALLAEGDFSIKTGQGQGVLIHVRVPIKKGEI